MASARGGAVRHSVSQRAVEKARVVGGTKKASNSFEVLNLTVGIILIVILIVTILCLIVLVIFFDRRTVGSLGLTN